MPIVPWLEVGLTPLLQFTVLPIFVFVIGRMLSVTKLK
ncbi:hypothetical protein C723_1569 [Christiangramia flava JLT2011]|nr:hypothetical protein C723_1569 [Christiangramia flava JLT2011]